VALLIGNNNYGSVPLRNAVNDARDLAKILREMGFKVILKEDTTRPVMVDALKEFGAAIEGASVAMFFYAGHGMQFKDQNYLLPIDAAMGSEEDVTLFALNMQQVFDRMERAKTKTNILILDACRENPFASSFRVSSGGLAQMNAPSGTLIAYSTAPGSVAADGFGRNGTYTKHLLNNISAPDLPVEIMFKRVREGVELETLRKQTPWDASSLKGDFAFNTTSERPAARPGAGGPSADMTLTMERVFWESAKESNRVDDLQAYLEKYPSGTFSSLAKNRLESLTRIAKAAAPGPAAAASEPPAKIALAEPAADRSPTVPAAPGSTTVAKAPGGAMPPAATQAGQQGAPQRSDEQKPAEKPAERPADKPVAVAATTQPAPQPAPAAPRDDKPVVLASAAPNAAAAAPPKPEQPGTEIAPGVREVKFPDGAIYRGGLRGSTLHGKGEYVARTFKYDGEFKDGLKEGKGVYVWENGNRYEGPFVKDSPEGEGKYIFANGDIYTGEVKGGALTGRGVYVTKAGDTLEGSFVNGAQQGSGMQRFVSGDRYEGQIVNSKAQGRGRYLGSDGHTVEGEFAEGVATGIGVYRFSNGDRYEGQITHSELTGKGSYFYKSGEKYEGQMVKGQPQGEGKYWFADGSRFEGTFEGLTRATGKWVKPDGSAQQAEIANGQARVVQ
jgi:hypothetical protein